MLAIVLDRLYVCSPRGKSAHPGVVIDLCQNPDDPTRVRFYQWHSKRVKTAADVPLVVHRIQHTHNDAEQCTHGSRGVLEFRAAEIGERLHRLTRKRKRLLRCLNSEQGTELNCQGLTSLAWHHEGRQFMCSHCDGSLSVWNLRSTDRPVSLNYPQGNETTSTTDCG